MIALFPYLWLSLAREDFTASSEFLDDVSNKASGDSEEDDLEGVDETKDKLLDKEWIRGGHQQDLGRSGLSSQDFKSNFSEKIHNS